MNQELTQEDWKQIALFYQNKFNELELSVLGLELNAAKAKQSEQQVVVADDLDD